MKIVPLNDIPFKGCQIVGYVFSYHSGSAGLKKCCTTDFCHIISMIRTVSAIVRLKWYFMNEIFWLTVNLAYYSSYLKIQHIPLYLPHDKNIKVFVLSSHAISSKNKNCNQITRKTNDTNDKNAHAFNPETYSFSTSFQVFFKGFVTLWSFFFDIFWNIDKIFYVKSIMRLIRSLNELKKINLINYMVGLKDYNTLISRKYGMYLHFLGRS